MASPETLGEDLESKIKFFYILPIRKKRLIPEKQNTTPYIDSHYRE